MSSDAIACRSHLLDYELGMRSCSVTLVLLDSNQPISNVSLTTQIRCSALSRHPCAGVTMTTGKPEGQA